MQQRLSFSYLFISIFATRNAHFQVPFIPYFIITFISATYLLWQSKQEDLQRSKLYLWRLVAGKENSLLPSLFTVFHAYPLINIWIQLLVQSFELNTILK